MEFGEEESQNSSVNPYLSLEDEDTTSHCDLKEMEKQGGESEAGQNVVENESEDLCKIVPEIIQDNSATELSDGGSGSNCFGVGGIQSKCANEYKDKGNGVEGIEHDGENIQSEADREVDESETSSKKLNVGNENDSNENYVFEGEKEVPGSNSTTYEGDINERNEEEAATNESSVISDSEGFENEENNQNMSSSFILEGDENEGDKSMNISGLEDDDNGRDTQNMNSFDSSDDNDISLYLSSSSDLENEETSQAMSNSVTEDDENEEISQTIDSSTLDGSESEDISQSTITSELQDDGEIENNQSMASSGLESEENEEKSQMMCNSGMERNENENCQAIPDSVMKDNESKNTLIRMEENDEMEAMNESSSEVEHYTIFPGDKKDNVLNEEDIQESNKECTTEEKIDVNTKRNANSCVIQEQLEDFTKETQGCLETEESRLKDTQKDFMERSLGGEEKIAESDDSVQNAEMNEDLRAVTEKEGEDAELETESRTKEKDGELQSEAEEEEMETEGCKVEGEEEGESKEATDQAKAEKNKTPTDVENDQKSEKEQLEKEDRCRRNTDVESDEMYEKELLEMEERKTDVEEMNTNKENDKTKESADEESEHSKKGDAATEESNTNRSNDWVTTGDHDEPDKDAHNLDHLDMNEPSIKLPSEINSKPQDRTTTNMHVATLSEDVQSQTSAKEIAGKGEETEEFNATKDVLNQVDKHGGDMDVSEKPNTSQESIPEEMLQDQNEEIGSESQDIKKTEIGCRSRDENISKEVMMQQNATTSQVSKELEHPGGETRCDDSGTKEQENPVTATPACKRKISSLSNEKRVTGKRKPSNPQNIAKKSTSKKTKVAVHKEQPSTQKKQDTRDSDDSDIEIVSETFKIFGNDKISNIKSFVCHRCYYLWNDEVLHAIFEGNKCVTVNSRITYGAILCFSSFASIHYPKSKEIAVRGVLERADLSKNIGNMNVKEVVEWVRCLMQSGSVSCCTVFDAVYNPENADAMLSSLLSPEAASKKKSEAQKSKQQGASKVKKTLKGQSCCTKTKHKAGTSSGTTTPSTSTAYARKMTSAHPKKFNDMHADKIPSTSHRDMHVDKTPTSHRDDLQSINKVFGIKECSVYLGKPVPITSQHRVRLYPTAKSRALMKEGGKLRESGKKRRSLSCEGSTDTNSSLESSVKDDAELPGNENPITDCSKYVNASFIHDSDNDDTMSKGSKSNLDASKNEESSLEHSSNIVTTESSNQSNQFDNTNVTESEESTANVMEDISEKAKAEGYKKDKTILHGESKTVERCTNKDIKHSIWEEKTGKTNNEDADQTLPDKSQTSTDDSKLQDDSRNIEKHDTQSTKATNRNEKAEQAITKPDKSERNEEVDKTDAEMNEKTGDVSDNEKETEKHDETDESEKRTTKDTKGVDEKYELSKEDMEDAKSERHERSEDSIMKNADDKSEIGDINMSGDEQQAVTEEQVVSAIESVGNTAEHEDLSEKVKSHDSKNTEPEDANMTDVQQQAVTEKQNVSSDDSLGNSSANQVKRSAEGSSAYSSKRQKVSDGTREKSPGDTQVQEAKDLSAAEEGVSSKPWRKRRIRTETRRLCSTDSKESESSVPASFEGVQSCLSSELTPNCESSDEGDGNTSKARRVSKDKTEEKILKSPKVLKSRSQRAVSKKCVSSSETSSDSNDLPMSKNDSLPQLKAHTNYRPVSSTIKSDESESILVQKLGLDINAIDLYCNTTDSKIPTNKDMANIPRQRGRLTKAFEAMLRERSNLDGVAKEAFDLLPFENNNLVNIPNNRERYLTNQELLVLQNICVLNPEAPDVDMFYQILIQVLLARRLVLMVPNSLALLVVTEKVRKEFNRAKRKGNHSEYLAQDWDPCKIYTTEDFWIAEKKPPKKPTVRTVLSIFCLWKNLEKRVPISLPIALEELCRNLVLWDVDKIGICVKLYSRYCTFLYEEKNDSLTGMFLNQPFIGSKTKLQKKLLYSKEDNSENTTRNLPSKHNTYVIENNVQELLKQCLEAEQAAFHSSNPREEEWFKKCVQALKDKVDLYKKDIQLIQKLTKDTEKKKFQLLSNLNSLEYEDLPQDLAQTTETLHRLLAKTTTKFEKLKEAECMVTKETNKVPKLSPTVLKAADLGEDISLSMKKLVYELLLSKVPLEEMRLVLCTIVENMTNKNITAVPSNSWLRNFARITGLKVTSHSSIV